MKRTFLAPLLFAASVTALGADLKLSVKIEPQGAVFGEPVRVTISISSEGDFALPRQLARCDLGHTHLAITSPDGRHVPISSDEVPCPKVLESPFASKSIKQYHCLATTSWNIFLLPGSYRVQAEYHSHGPYLDRYSQTDERPVSGIWEGDLTSNVAELEISTPKDGDLLALRSLGLTTIDNEALTSIASFLRGHTGDFLSRFPTSTYAAYVVWEHSDAGGLARSEPSKVARALETGLILRSEMTLPCADTSGKFTTAIRNGKEAIDCRAYWYNLILKNHPDIWFANELRIRRALDQASLKNFQAAQAELEAIAKDEKASMAPRAKEYLDLMKQKGWIKP